MEKNFVLMCLALLFLRCWSMSLVTLPPEVMEDKPIDVSSDPNARAEAMQHVQMMNTKFCSTPVPKLFPVKQFYPSTSRRYKPHCVLLHRCNLDAGCCHTDTMQCSPSSTEIVHLNFIVNELTLEKNTQERKFIRMPFVNHTSCACLPRASAPR